MRGRSLILAVSVVALLTALVAPGAAYGHATLEATTPPRGAVVERQPEAVVFRFDEPVEGNFGAVRVYDAQGSRVDEGDAFHPDGEGEKLAVDLKPELPEGSYTATYRVVSADAHVISGGFVFSIGKAGRAPRQTVAELVAASGSGTVAELGLGLSRGVQYAALALALGGLAFLVLVWWPARRRFAASGERWAGADLGFEQRLTTLLTVAALAGLLSAAGAVVFEAAQAAGVSAGAALDLSLIREELGTRFGTVWGLTALAWLAFGLGVRPALRRSSPHAIAALCLPLALAILEPALSGHPSTQSPVALLFTANVLHVIAMAVWVGGLAMLLFVLPAATRELEPDARSRLLAANLARFSPLALLCVAAILLTGIGQAYAYVRHVESLFDTAYGRAVLIKLVLLGGLLIPLGAYNRRRSLPHLRRIAAGGEPPGRAGRLLRRTLRAEVALLAVVIGVTAALAGYAPPTAAQSGPFSTRTALGPAELELTVDPARVGANQVHIYLFDARSGAQYRGIEELRASASLPDRSIGPLQLEAQRAGPGHYTVQGAPLNVPGDWDLEIAMRVSAFDEHAATVEVPIR